MFYIHLIFKFIDMFVYKLPARVIIYIYICEKHDFTKDTLHVQKVHV